MYSVQGKPVNYIFVGDPHIQCMDACGGVEPSPSGHGGADAMVSHFAHEIVEAMTDPDGWSGWIDEDGNENAGGCECIAHFR